MTFRTAALAACALLLSFASALATDLPDLVQRRLADAQKLCTEHGGKPGATDAVVTARDIDGDGRNDYLLDFRKLTCDGADVFCAGSFCSIDVYTWRSPDKLARLLAADVSHWETRRIGKQPALVLTQSGGFCGKPKQPTCTVTYTFADGKMHGRTR